MATRQRPISALVGSVVTLASAVGATVFYNKYGPTLPKLHALAHYVGWPTLNGVLIPYHGIDSRIHLGLFCDQCGGMFSRPGCPDPDVPPKRPLSQAFSELDALNLFSRVAYNKSYDWQPRNDHTWRLYQLCKTSGSDHRSEVISLMREHGFSNVSNNLATDVLLCDMIGRPEYTCNTIPSKRSARIAEHL